MKRKRDKYKGWLRYLIILSAIMWAEESGAYSQQECKPVILSPKVGQAIDLAERNNYSLFPQFENFDSAAVFITGKDKYFISFTLRGNNGVSYDTTVWYPDRLIMILSEKIDHIDQLRDGSYSIGDSEAQLQYSNTPVMMTPPKYDPPPAIPGKTFPPPRMLFRGLPDNLPFPKERPVTGFQNYSISLGINFTYVSADFSGVHDAFTAIEDKYRAQGYSIMRHDAEMNLPMMIGAHLQLRISRNLYLSVETGRTTSEGETEKFQMISGSVNYRFKPFGTNLLEAHAGIGIGRYSFQIMRRYGLSNRISELRDRYGQINPLGEAYTYLNSLASSGQSAVFPLGFGLELLLAGQFSIGLQGNYSFAPDVTLDLVSGPQSRINLGGFHAGGRISIYY